MATDSLTRDQRKAADRINERLAVFRQQTDREIEAQKVREDRMRKRVFTRFLLNIRDSMAGR